MVSLKEIYFSTVADKSSVVLPIFLSEFELDSRLEKCRFVIKQFAYTNNSKFWEDLIAYFPLIQHGSHRKQKIREGYTDSKVMS
jgi:hypothetical protein